MVDRTVKLIGFSYVAGLFLSVSRNGVSCSGGKVMSLDLYANGLSGSVPSELGLLTGVTQFSLSYNSLSGSIPSEFGAMTEMVEWFDLRMNMFTGSIPSEFGAMTGMRMVFMLSHNSLSGSIPSEFGAMTGLAYWFEAKDNELTGSIPSEFGAMTGLTKNFQLFSNQVSPHPSRQPQLARERTRSSHVLSTLRRSCVSQLCDDIPSELSALSTQVTSQFLVATGNDLGTPCGTNDDKASDGTKDLGAILGGVFGGLTFLCICIFVVFRSSARKSSRRPPHVVAQMSPYQPSDSSSSTLEVEPSYPPTGRGGAGSYPPLQPLTENPMMAVAAPSVPTPATHNLEKGLSKLTTDSSSTGRGGAGSHPPLQPLTENPVMAVAVPCPPTHVVVAVPSAPPPHTHNLEMSNLDKGKGLPTLSTDSSSSSTSPTTSHPLMNKRVKIRDAANPKSHDSIGLVTAFNPATQTFTVELFGFKGTISDLREENLVDSD